MKVSMKDIAIATGAILMEPAVELIKRTTIVKKALIESSSPTMPEEDAEEFVQRILTNIKDAYVDSEMAIAKGASEGKSAEEVYEEVASQNPDNAKRVKEFEELINLFEGELKR